MLTHCLVILYENINCTLDPQTRSFDGHIFSWLSRGRSIAKSDPLIPQADLVESVATKKLWMWGHWQIVQLCVEHLILRRNCCNESNNICYALKTKMAIFVDK